MEFVMANAVPFRAFRASQACCRQLTFPRKVSVQPKLQAATGTGHMSPGNEQSAFNIVM